MVVRGRLVYTGIIGSEMGGERGGLLFRSTWNKRGSLEFNGENCSSGETSVGMYKLKEAIEKFCSNLLASHRRKCDCALAGMAIWRFFSHRKVMESLLVGIGY
jgi:hypothetical protein